MPPVRGFGCLELVLYGIRVLAEQHYESNLHWLDMSPLLGLVGRLAELLERKKYLFETETERRTSLLLSNIRGSQRVRILKSLSPVTSFHCGWVTVLQISCLVSPSCLLRSCSRANATILRPVFSIEYWCLIRVGHFLPFAGPLWHNPMIDPFRAWKPPLCNKEPAKDKKCP